MGLKYSIHQKDQNADALRLTAEKLGLCVWPIGRPVDWLVTGFGVAVGCEVKTDKGKLRPDQIAFLAAAGAAGRVLRTEQDVIELQQFMRQMSATLAEGWI